MKIDNVNKGEIVYCNIEFEYKRNNSKNFKPFRKKINQCIFARNYDCETFPILNVVKYPMLINKIDIKNAYYITNVKIVNLKILAKTGYKYKNLI
tara:strand:- start:487 stop:771 length:285 start_codon:yes stop_codon:yes gene_type:complete